MHLVNRVLSLLGLKLTRVGPTVSGIDPIEKEFREKYELDFKQVENDHRGFEVHREYRYEIGEHPKNFRDLELEFSASHLYKAKPSEILDIGTYRGFILGLLANYNVTTVDVRKRKSIVDNETVVTCDAKALTFASNSFDSVISIECLPHIGLGRYGDEIDLNGDIKAFKEMLRVLKPGGMLIFSAAITGGQPSISWNARRNYSYKMIREFCEALHLVEEKFIDLQGGRFCTLEELTTDSKLFDYYIGCWRK